MPDSANLDVCWCGNSYTRQFLRMCTVCVQTVHIDATSASIFTACMHGDYVVLRNGQCLVLMCALHAFVLRTDTFA